MRLQQELILSFKPAPIAGTMMAERLKYMGEHVKKISSALQKTGRLHGISFLSVNSPSEIDIVTLISNLFCGLLRRYAFPRDASKRSR